MGIRFTLLKKKANKLHSTTAEGGQKVNHTLLSSLNSEVRELGMGIEPRMAEKGIKSYESKELLVMLKKMRGLNL